MTDDRFDALLRDAARGYNRPPEPPRDALWARIQAERQRREAPRRPSLRPWHWGAGMAAMLAIGVGLGRLTLEPPAGGAATAPGAHGGPPAAEPPGETSPATLPYRLAAAQHLSRTEAFLASYRSETRAGVAPRDLSEWARELLTGTRLLLDSPAADDPRLRLLLQDLELVLAQIAQLPAAGNPREEVRLIDEALEQHGTLARLRTAVPAGPAVADT